MRKTTGLIAAVLLCIIGAVSVPISVSARDISPIINTDWLNSNLKDARLVILDIRKVEDYKAGHIPGAVNAFYGAWAITNKEGLLNEVPQIDDLLDTISSAGIDTSSLVVVVSTSEALVDRANAARVAWTLKHVGLSNISILDGGHNKWLSEKKTVSTDIVRPKPKSYSTKTTNNLFVNKPYVLSRLGKATIIDSREKDFFEGTKKLDFVAKEGPIAGATHLPTSEVFTQAGTYKDKSAIEAMAAILGKDLSKEIIVYCDSGRVATIWAFLLSEALGFSNVKVYDGSVQEWTKDPAGPLGKK